MAQSARKLIANNKKVYHDYFLDEKYEAGVALAGTEVKSLRMGNIFNKDPLRPKKLLMHKQEIRKLIGKIKEKGYTLVPVEVYFSGSLVKVEIALARGKKLYDKRQDIAKKDQKREAARDLKVSLRT